MPIWAYTLRKLIQKDTCTAVFIAALFTTARTWEKPRWSLTDEWREKLWCIHAMDYCSAIRRSGFELVEMRWINLEPVKQSEVRKRKTNIY